MTQQRFCAMSHAARITAGIVLSVWVAKSASLYQYTSFDVPGYPGAWASGINDAGEVVGRAQNQGSSLLGFLRSSDGTTYSFFTLPPAGISSADPFLGINNAGQVAGTGPCANTACGYIRDPSGAITYFAPNGVGAGVYGAINNAGQVAGEYSDPPFSGGTLGFVRNPDGSYETVKVPGSQTTLAFGIGNDGAVVGQYTIQGESTSHAFIRSPDGATYSSFDVPGGGYMWAQDINTRGEVLARSAAGEFVRNPDGTFTSIQFPGTVNSVYGFTTFADSLNDEGQVVGTYEDVTTGTYHGFIADPVTTPIPEPCGLLLCAGPITLWALRKSRRSSGTR